MSSTEFDRVVDVLVVGSGGGGMTAALTAQAAGLDTLVVEKAAQFGGSTALSGGGIWVPGAPSQRREGYVPDPEETFTYLKRITDGLVSDERLRTYVDAAPQMMDFLEKRSRWFEFVWKPGYADYYPELPGGSALGSTINVPAIDLRELGDEEQHLLQPLALAPKGIWFAPKDLRLFYQVRQNWRGKAVLVKLIWRMVREMLNAPPQPVSISTSSGRSVTSVMRRTSISTSSMVVMPRSGMPQELAATPPPDT